MPAKYKLSFQLNVLLGFSSLLLPSLSAHSNEQNFSPIIPKVEDFKKVNQSRIDQMSQGQLALQMNISGIRPSISDTLIADANHKVHSYVSLACYLPDTTQKLKWFPLVASRSTTTWIPFLLKTEEIETNHGKALTVANQLGKSLDETVGAWVEGDYINLYKAKLVTRVEVPLEIAMSFNWRAVSSSRFCSFDGLMESEKALAQNILQKIIQTASTDPQGRFGRDPGVMNKYLKCSPPSSQMTALESFHPNQPLVDSMEIQNRAFKKVNFETDAYRSCLNEQKEILEKFIAADSDRALLSEFVRKSLISSEIVLGVSRLKLGYHPVKEVSSDIPVRVSSLRPAAFFTDSTRNFLNLVPLNNVDAAFNGNSNSKTHLAINSILHPDNRCEVMQRQDILKVLQNLQTN